MTTLGDFNAGCVIFDVFTTVDASGRPAALAGSPAPFLVAFKDAFAEAGACTVTGLVLALNCNGRTGVNGWSATTTLDAAFFACGHQYQVVLQGGCVDSLCVSGYVIGRFSLNKDSALKPLIHGRTVDVTAGGAVGVDWGNVENAATAQALACTTTFSVKNVENAVTPTACSAIFSVQSVLNAVTPTACSAIFSVQSVLNAVTPTACSTIYEVVTLSNSAVAKILDTAIVEPAGVFAWASGSLRNIVGWLGALSSNCLRQTATLQTVRARDDLTALATAALTCEATTVHRGSFT